MVKELKQIVDNMAEFLNEQNFVQVENEVGHYKNDKKDFVILFDTAKKLFTLNIADIENGEVGSYSTVSTWLFDETHREDDTKTIAKDFCDVLFKNLGLVRKKINGVESVQLPGKTLTGQTPNIEGFTGKFLSIFPQYKEEYKQNVAKYGDFLYVEFYKTYGVEKLKELLSDKKANKKQLSKYLDMLGNMFEEGDSTVSAVITSVIIAGAFLDNYSEYEQLHDEIVEKHKEFYNAGRNSILLAIKDKKLRGVLVK